MSPYQAITLDFKPMDEPVTHTDFTYSITPTTISITDTGKGKTSVTNDIEAVLRKIEYWHQGSIAGFKIMYRDENGVWDGVR
jgi:predicted ATP-binding protein involved in virulence